jgi:AAA+ ATPase superfamily predicted ATPase
MSAIIGRKNEIAYLQEIIESGAPEFVAVYGRRRVGKTFLIREFFNKNFTFYFSGSENSSMKTQLENFRNAYQVYFKAVVPTPENWTTAFAMLKDAISNVKKPGRKVVFIDELPWITTKGSNFIQAFEYWWNTFASANPEIVLIICGSSTSWMLNKIIKNRGGLHNRVTRQILLQPFSLKECTELAKQQKLPFDDKTILDYYMIFGGVPYYWKHLSKSKSLPQNIDNLLFSNNAVLKNEFTEIYNSLFKHSEKYIALIISLEQKRMGLSREDILKISGLTDGGSITRMLEELEQCGFIRSYYGFGKKSKDKLYQLIDLFSLFYLNFIKDKNITDEQFWTNNFDTAPLNNWRGYAFEQVCLWHVPQIKDKLGISGVSTSYSSWRSSGENPEKKKYQIDLVIDRNDRVINLCEMKYSDQEYSIDKDYNDHLRRRKATFMEENNIRKTVHTTMITTFGVNRNTYWGNVQSEVTLEDLAAF